jgi:DNA-binding CsgD family transcriptional regulator
LASRANYVAGQASYLRSRSDLAAPYYKSAIDLAATESDQKNALWGAFLASADIDLDAATAYLTELEAGANDLDTRLRVVVARQTIASQRGTFSGLWESAQSLLPLAKHATDPLVWSNFLAQAGYLALARANYAASAKLVSEALDLSNKLHHDFATACCLAYRAGAQIGLRRLASANRDLALLAQTAAHWEDPYLQTQRSLMEARLSIAQGDLPGAQAKLENLSKGMPDSVTQGERLALLSLAQASRGKPQEASELAEQAREITHATEARFLSRFAEQIVEIDRRGAQGRLAALIADAFEADYADSFVVSYRCFPELLTLAAQDPVTLEAISPVVRGARDQRLAGRMGLKISKHSATSGARLTLREQEVLDLLGLGLSNGEIAQRLFITESTAKVHVRNILEKLGVKNRVQAALLAGRED